MNEKLIIENHSNHPFHMSLNKAFDLYFEWLRSECSALSVTWDDFKLTLRQDKETVTIQIYDIQ